MATAHPSSPLAPVDTVRIDLPNSWQHLPLDLEGLSAALGTTDTNEAWSRLGTTDRRRVELYLRRLLEDIQAANASFAAVYSEVIPVDGEDDTALVASVVVSLLDRATVGSELPFSPAVVQAAMAAERDDESPVLANLRSTNLEVPSIVELRHAAAVLVRRLIEVSYTSADTVQVSTHTYMVTVPDEYEQLVVVQFSTPNIGDSEMFAELFAALADTVRFYREGEETTL